MEPTGEKDEVLEDLSWRETWALLGVQWGATEFKVVVMAGSVCYTGYLLKHGGGWIFRRKRLEAGKLVRRLLVQFSQ